MCGISMRLQQYLQLELCDGVIEKYFLVYKLSQTLLLNLFSIN